jgi:YHS domain-containing protein
MTNVFFSRRALVNGFVGCLLFSAPGFGRSLVEPVNKDASGTAIKGQDPVAYFQSVRPVKGAPQFSHTWMGATWLFSSAANRDLFVANPQQYAPQFGGYCAWAVSKNYTADTDPEAWRIIDGKLYLNYSRSVQKTWEKDVQKRIEDGNRNWPGLHKE